MDNDRIILPVDVFAELNAAANSNTQTLSERALQSVQTTLFCAALGGAFVGSTWAFVKATDWLEERRFQRATRKTKAS